MVEGPAVGQTPKKSQLSGQQTLTRKNFPDVRKFLFRDMYAKSA